MPPTGKETERKCEGKQGNGKLTIQNKPLSNGKNQQKNSETKCSPPTAESAPVAERQAENFSPSTTLTETAGNTGEKSDTLTSTGICEGAGSLPGLESSAGIATAPSGDTATVLTAIFEGKKYAIECLKDGSLVWPDSLPKYRPAQSFTVAENVQAHGTGAINVDGCRVGTNDTYAYPNGPRGNTGTGAAFNGVGMGRRECLVESSPLGRWPANVIHDGSEEVTRLFPNQKSPAPYARTTDEPDEYRSTPGTIRKKGDIVPGFGDSGSAARFFYCAKASKEDREWALRDGGIGALRDGFEKKQRDEGRKEGNPGGDNPRNRGVNKVHNHHPTVKPLDLMRYLCRLVTPPGGIVLDPFAGSGSTLRGAFLEGFKPIGIELDAEYCRIARGRMNLLTAGLPFEVAK